jgi:hypothetical protein
LPEFAELIKESAARIQARQETDSIELLDDIRFYLNERFRLRFDDAGLDELMEEQPQPANGEDTAQTEDLENITEGVEAMKIAKTTAPDTRSQQPQGYTREIRTLDGALVEDEFDEDAMNYQILLEKLDALLERLNLDA